MTNAITTNKPEWQTSLDGAKNAFIQQCGDAVKFGREYAFACQILRANTYLQGCDQDSLRSALVNVALTGATLSPAMQQAFLVPRKVKNKLLCCLDFSYRGLIQIAVDGGAILDMDATVVYENDHFIMKQGLNPVLDHEPVTIGERGKIAGVYAIATYKEQQFKKFIHMTKEDIEKIRKTSQAPNSPMWTQFPEEGARKSAIKRLYKMLPQTDRMNVAIDVLNEYEGLADKADKGKELAGRFGGELPPGKVEEPTEALIAKIDSIENLAELDAFIAGDIYTLASEADTDKVQEALDYKRSELKEAK